MLAFRSVDFSESIAKGENLVSLFFGVCQVEPFRMNPKRLAGLRWIDYTHFETSLCLIALWGFHFGPVGVTAPSGHFLFSLDGRKLPCFRSTAIRFSKNHSCYTYKVIINVMFIK